MIRSFHTLKTIKADELQSRPSISFCLTSNFSFRQISSLCRDKAAAPSTPAPVFSSIVMAHWGRQMGKCLDEGQVGAMGEGLHDGKLYFDRLSEDAIENIILFVSSKPRSHNWTAYVHPEIALGILESETVLVRCFKSVVRYLEPPPHDVCYPNRMSVTEAIHYGSHHLPKVLPALRKTVTSLKIDMAITFPETLRRALTFKCSQLKRLSVSIADCFPLSSVLSTNGENLSFLDIKKPSLSEEDVSAIAEFGKGLKGLGLSLQEMSAQMTSIWKSIGESIEDVRISQEYTEIDFDMPSIMHNCKNLQAGSIERIRWRRNEIEALCRSLGPNLKSLALEDVFLEPFRLHRIVAACKNVALDLRGQKECCTAELTDIGRHVSSFNIEGHDSESLVPSFKEFGNLAKIISWGEFPQGTLRALFQQPKPLLKEFDGHFPSSRNLKIMFEGLASSAPLLEKLSLIGRLPERSVLLHFVEASVMLKTVDILDMRETCNCMRTKSVPVEGTDLDFDSAAAVLLLGARLETLSITCWTIYSSKNPRNVKRNDDFATGCLGARSRGTSVTICKRQYW